MGTWSKRIHVTFSAINFQENPMYRTCSIPSFLTYESTQYCYISYNSLFISILQHIYKCTLGLFLHFCMFIRCRVRLIHFFLTSGQQLVSQECGDCVWLISFCTLQNLSSWKHRRRRASAAAYQRVEEVDSVGQEEEDKKKPKTYGEMMADRYKALSIFLMNFFFLPW